MTAEKYLRPEVIRQVSRLDLRAKFIVEGFLTGLHASPFHGFSVEFSEHRKYVPGDDLKDLDWNVYAKTDRYYVKKFEAETNVTGYLVMDLSASMAYTYRQELTKFDYAICLAAALGYLMIHQQDPVGLVTFDTKIQTALPPKSKRTQLGTILGLLAGLKPAGQTDIGACLHQLASMIRSKSLVMLFSDLLTDPKPVLESLYHLRHRGNDIILFHVLDEAEAHFPFEGIIEFEDVEAPRKLTIDAQSMRPDYLRSLGEFQNMYREECAKAGIAQRLKDAGLHHAFVSLHSPVAAVSDAITRAPGTFVRTIKGIQALLDAGVRVALNAVITTDSIDSVADLPDFIARTFGAHPQLYALVVSDAGDMFEKDLIPRLVPHPDRMREVLPRLVENALAAGITLEGLGNACGPHLCLFGADARVTRIRPIPGPVDFRTYLPECDQCSVKYACLGVRSAHASLYGSACVRPIQTVRER